MKSGFCKIISDLQAIQKRETACLSAPDILMTVTLSNPTLTGLEHPEPLCRSLPFKLAEYVETCTVRV